MGESHNPLRGCIPNNLQPPSKPYLSKFLPPYNINGLGLRLLQSGHRETLKNISVTVCTWKQKALLVYSWIAGALVLNSVRYKETCDTSSSACAMCTMVFLERAIKIEAQSKYISAQHSLCIHTRLGTMGVLWVLCDFLQVIKFQENVLGCISLFQSERTSEDFW